jgi:hypothetical protein
MRKNSFSFFIFLSFGDFAAADVMTGRREHCFQRNVSID